MSFTEREKAIYVLAYGEGRRTLAANIRSGIAGALSVDPQWLGAMLSQPGTSIGYRPDRDDPQKTKSVYRLYSGRWEAELDGGDDAQLSRDLQELRRS